jgi:hypothetical protein
VAGLTSESSSFHVFEDYVSEGIVNMVKGRRETNATEMKVVKQLGVKPIAFSEFECES